MVEFFKGLADLLSSVIDFVISVIEGLFRMVKYIGIALQSIAGVMSYIPADLAALAAAFISVAVVYLIIGREG